MLILKPPLPLQANGPWSPPICCRYWKGMSSDTSLCPFRGQGIGGGTRRVCFKYKNASALLLRRRFSPKPPRLNHRGGKMTWSGFPSSPKDGTPRTCRWYILDAQERGQFITCKGGPSYLHAYCAGTRREIAERMESVRAFVQPAPSRTVPHFTISSHPSQRSAPRPFQGLLSLMSGQGLTQPSSPEC